MNYKALILITSFSLIPSVVLADDTQLHSGTHQLQQPTEDAKLQGEIHQLQQQTKVLQTQLNNLQKKLVKQQQNKPKKSVKNLTKNDKKKHVHNSLVRVKVLDRHPESVEYNPAALIANNHVVTYIAGMPVVSASYLGARPAFDGSDYLVNISSINRDVRLMEQRRKLYRAYEKMGYPIPNLPIVTISGKAEPIGSWNHDPTGVSKGDWTLGSSELDAAAAVNDNVEAYIALAYDESPPSIGGARVANSGFNLNMGFINIGDLDKSPYYFTAGQLYVPFGRFSTAMVSAPLTMRMARTKTRPIIFGYKSQKDFGPFGAVYAYKSDTTLGNSGVGGVNLGYVFKSDNASGEVGASLISSLDDAGGMQYTGSTPGTTFGGFASYANGSERVHKVPGAGVHGNIGFDRYSITAEWVGTLGGFREQDLSFNGHGAQPQAVQVEGGATFMAFDKPASIGVGYQWSKETLALNMPEHRINGVFNISIWKDTVESLEYRHDVNYGVTQFANGIAATGNVNQNTIGPGGSTDTLLAQIGVYF